MFGAVNVHRMFASLSLSHTHTILLTSWLSPSMKASLTLAVPLFSSVILFDRSLWLICRLRTLFTNFLLYPFSTKMVRIVSSSRSWMAFELHTLKARSTKHLMQGRSYRGFGGFGRTPPWPRAGKGPQKSGLFFFLAGSHAQESVLVEKDERTPPTENKSCKTRHGQVNIRMAFRPNAVAAKENQP